MNDQLLVNHRMSFSYGLLALPLAFVALPMYVNLPHYYATQFAIPLASLGAVLLTSRLIDAFVDPWMGRVSDALYGQSVKAVMLAASVLCFLLMISFALLFFPPAFSSTLPYVLWVAVCVTFCHLSYSGLSILHQAWATRLGGGPVQQSRVVTWREGAGLVGVVTASVLPALAGWPLTTLVLSVMLLLGLLAWFGVLQKSRAKTELVNAAPLKAETWLPMQQALFVKLLLVFLLNGIASAVPASLVMFFVEDQIRATAEVAPWFLGVYFLSGALSLPLWLWLVRTQGLPRAWGYGMVLAVVSFVWVSFLGAGDEVPFLWVCIASGVALGADLVVPAALLNRVIDSLGHRGHAEGLYLGWWNLTSKFNLALSAGLCLPLLSFWGYTPGVQSEEGLRALSLAYGVLPCVLKLAALAALFVFWIQPSASLPASRSQ